MRPELPRGGVTLCLRQQRRARSVNEFIFVRQTNQLDYVCDTRETVPLHLTAVSFLSVLFAAPNESNLAIARGAPSVYFQTPVSLPNIECSNILCDLDSRIADK